MARGKKILVGITAGIAAYKSVFLVRELVKMGAEVKVVMTPSASDFVTPLTLATLSKNKVYSTFVASETEGVWNNHVELGLWADLMVVAPLSANTLAKMASGICDNLLLATLFSAKCPIMVAPAMDLDMYHHPTTKRNISQLESDGVSIIPAESGELASGLSGEGRMAEPSTIVSAIDRFFSQALLFEGKEVMITAGPTYEEIDPVRFLGNRSSGKMGFALAKAFAHSGAKVHLITGPSALGLTHPKVTITRVQSAQEMHNAATEYFSKVDIGVFAAAVSDYRPKKKADQKMKKKEELTLELVKNPDILKACANQKSNKQLVVGFALETEKEEHYAKQKLRDKKADLIVLNSLQDAGAGFSGDTNKVTVFDKDNNSHKFELMDKHVLAQELVRLLATYVS